jgi:hypothetical protein
MKTRFLLGASVALLAGAGAFGAIRYAGKRSKPASSQFHAGFGHHKLGPDKRAERLRRIQQGLPGADPAAGLGGPLTREEEKLANRAIPFDTLPPEMTDLAQQSAAQVAMFHDADEQMPFLWKSIGPTNAVYPALLNRTSAPYVASGRITALAIDPRCGLDDDDEEGACRLFVGAAGGGIWRTDNALSRKPRWSFISGSFATNAIGSIVLDPADPNTIYVGTGEPNISGDSAAGLGIYKSTDGGDSWTELPAVATVNGITYRNFAKNLSISSVVVDPSDRRTIYVGAALGVRGVSAVGGATNSIPGMAPVGLYKSTDGGATFTRIWNAGGSRRGVNAVAIDPADSRIVYAASVNSGIWRSWASDKAGAGFQQVFRNQSQLVDPDRTEFAITRLSSGKIRVYAATGALGPFSGYSAPLASESQVWRIDDATRDAATLVAEQNAVVAGGAAVPGGWKKLTESANGTPGYATYNFCTGQCWYDIGIYTPVGEPDTVFVIGSYQYSEAGRRSNSRAVLRSTTAGEPNADGVTFTDLSRDSADPQNGIHPDQHALVFLPAKPAVWFEGSDGGLMRSSGKYTSIASQCDGRNLGPASLTTCKRLLSSVPTELTSLNFGLNTLQFQSLSINPQKPLRELLGGTQDNGTFQYEGSKVTWMQTIFGDGGQSGFDAANPTNRFHTYFAPQVDVNFRGGDPQYWVWISDPFFMGQVEGSSFYIPIIADPNPARGGSIFAGLQSVWRTQDNGGSQAFLEANCGELLPSADPNATCGDWVRISPKLAPNSKADPDTWVAALARAPGDTSTLWAGTRAGKVFISRNADAAATSVSWTRLDGLSPAAPNRFPSAIDVDPANPLHAFISYSGYSARTPVRPGHVFEVVYDPASGTATWTSLDEGFGPLGDVPVTALVRDQASGDLYAGTDFGVLRRPAATGHWHLASQGMPAVEVTQLSYNESAHVIYASTHGRGAWRLILPGGADQD